jgi:acyl-coenzyme A synthetase/AMP-(fatty) acid ligase
MASVATPEDMRAAPGTVGKPPLGTSVAILDGQGQRLHNGQTGRIFVANAITFEGYTSGDDIEDEVRVYVKRRLAGYKVPRDVVFIDALPRNATGKVLKRKLEQN